MKDGRIKLKVKIKSLACEAKIIRKEEKKARGHLKACLHYHRITKVREASRYAQLAYGFIRGIAYDRMERDAKIMPREARLITEIERFGVCLNWDAEDRLFADRKKEQEVRLAAWLKTMTLLEKELV